MKISLIFVSEMFLSVFLSHTISLAGLVILVRGSAHNSLTLTAILHVHDNKKELSVCPIILPLVMCVEILFLLSAVNDVYKYYFIIYCTRR